MKQYKFDSAKFDSAFNILNSNHMKLNDNVNMLWCVVSPGEISKPHSHRERELYLIVSGSGVAHTQKEEFNVSTGDIITISPHDIHYISNNGADKLIFVDMYWNSNECNTKSKIIDKNPIYIFSPPPTPNGDLHLGHLSGPYLGADVYKRFEQMRGREVYHLTGSDDYQSYVRSLARKQERNESYICTHYASRIREVLDLFKVEHDNFLQTAEDQEYSEYVKQRFNDIKDKLDLKDVSVPYDNKLNQYLYEADIGGKCPTCDNPTNGNICEDCGEPNSCLDLKESKSNITFLVPGYRDLVQYSLPLHEYHDQILLHLDKSNVRPRVRLLAEKILKRKGFDVSLTHPEIWGVKLGDENVPNQSIWVWVNMLYGFLYAIEKITHKQGKSWEKVKDNCEIVHFFGYDNSFYYTVLYPALLELSYPGLKASFSYIHNEFYLLNNQKFSTSRNHAIWGREILNEDTVDIIRYFLSKTRAENKQTNFNMSELISDAKKVLVTKWQNWVFSLQNKVEKTFSGRVPDTGLWLSKQETFVRALEYKIAEIELYYSRDGFSLRSAIRESENIFDEIIDFSDESIYLSKDDSLKDYYRTSVAIELMTLRIVAKLIYPIMPGYAMHLLSLIGLNDNPTWEDKISYVEVNSSMDTENNDYFTKGFEFIENYSKNSLFTDHEDNMLVLGEAMQ